eukprot:1159774-Pelagomonas_calceolata.AAC.13
MQVARLGSSKHGHLEVQVRPIQWQNTSISKLAKEWLCVHEFVGQWQHKATTRLEGIRQRSKAVSQGEGDDGAQIAVVHIRFIIVGRLHSTAAAIVMGVGFAPGNVYFRWGSTDKKQRTGSVCMARSAAKAKFAHKKGT